MIFTALCYVKITIFLPMVSKIKLRFYLKPVNREYPYSSVGMRAAAIIAIYFCAHNFKAYSEEVEMWREVCNILKAKQGIMLWLALPRGNPSDIKELIMSKVGKEELKKETGVDRFVQAMEEAFKPTDEIRDMEVYRNFYQNMKRKEGEKITDFINRFDKCANLAKQ